jgi:hypothetical protein
LDAVTAQTLTAPAEEELLALASAAPRIPEARRFLRALQEAQCALYPSWLVAQTYEERALSARGGALAAEALAATLARLREQLALPAAAGGQWHTAYEDLRRAARLALSRLESALAAITCRASPGRLCAFPFGARDAGVWYLPDPRSARAPELPLWPTLEDWLSQEAAALECLDPSARLRDAGARVFAAEGTGEALRALAEFFQALADEARRRHARQDQHLEACRARAQEALAGAIDRLTCAAHLSGA